MRAVRRQILVNAHKKTLLKAFKVNTAMVLAVDRKDFEPPEKNSAFVSNSKLSYQIEKMLSDRLENDTFDLTTMLERISNKTFRNNFTLEQV